MHFASFVTHSHAFCLFPNTFGNSFSIWVVFFSHQFAVSGMLKQLAVSLALRCLSYDFVGTSVDESSEEFGTVQVFSLSSSVYLFIICCPYWLTCRKKIYAIQALDG